MIPPTKGSDPFVSNTSIGRTQLRRDFQPYVGMGIANVFSVLMVGIMAIDTKTWAPLWEFGWLPPLLFAGWVYLGMRYRVSYTDIGIEMIASGLAPAFIQFDGIARIENEVSIQRGRPLRRIAIYSSKQGGKVKWVDVSLKHFKIEDIRVLLDMIRQKRHDLEIPQI
jgi:hypothetical protein